MPDTATPRTPRSAPRRWTPGARWTALAAAALLVSGPAAHGQDTGERLDPPAPTAARKALAATTARLAKCGRRTEVRILTEILRELGHPEKELVRQAEAWERELARRALTAPPSGIVRDLRAQSAALARELQTRELQREQLARLVLSIDDQNAAAGTYLGHSFANDTWSSPARSDHAAGLERVVDQLLGARSLGVPVGLAPSELPALENIHPTGGAVATGHGVELHGTLDPERMRRVLRQALRGAALSNALLTGRLEVPRQVRGKRFLVVESRDRYRLALAEAAASDGLNAADHALQLEIEQNSFLDRRGWRTCSPVPDAELSALLLWDLMPTWLDRRTQPMLAAGHLNWVCTELLGTPMPATLWRESGPRGESTQVEVPASDASTLWRAAQRNTTASRLWATEQLKRDRRTGLDRCMLDQMGRIHGPLLVKSTLAVAYFQEHGRLAELIDATRGRSDRVAALEEALGYRLEVFERDWEGWLTGGRRGLVQRLQSSALSGPDRAGQGFVEELERLRRRALVNPRAEFVVTLDPSLSLGAENHARYLVLNSDLRDDWRELHRERADRPGFTDEGAKAGAISVIYIGGGGDPAVALEQWSNTFYHRLPLLEPGLFGVGLGRDEDVVVLDAGTLVAPPEKDHWVLWPPAGETDVPLALAPELPNPVPGEEQALLGYPITLQVRLLQPGAPPALTLSLHRGGPEGPLVDCHSLPLEGPGTEPIPPGTWGLIPRERLEPRTRYAVRAELQPGWTGSGRGAAGLDRDGIEERLSGWVFTTGR